MYSQYKYNKEKSNIRIMIDGGIALKYTRYRKVSR